MALKYQRVPGTHDVYPNAPEYQDNSALWQLVESTFRNAAHVYGYDEIRTPAFEVTELFKRAVGEGTDIVSKEMYTFDDRGERSLTLRPEGTAPVVRAYLENGLHGRGGVTKLFYIAANFRAERAQRGRYKQHTQVGLEALGTEDPRIDAEIIHLAASVLATLGLKNLTLFINSVGCPECRPRYREALVAFAAPLAEQMSEENRRRLAENPLRMLDSKNERDQALLAEAPTLLDYLCDECRNHFDSVRSFLEQMSVVFEVNAKLVRGFDYYTKTAFEFVSSDLGAQSTVCGGGRYDGLVEELGGPNTPGIGFGMGVERVLIAMQEGQKQSGEPERHPSAFIVAMGGEAQRQAMTLLSEMRSEGLRADTDFAGSGFKAQLRAADRSRARYYIILGDDEIAAGVVTIRDKQLDTQEKVPLNSYVAYLQGKRQSG